jgi:hypothetical protein
MAASAKVLAAIRVFHCLTNDSEKPLSSSTTTKIP